MTFRSITFYEMFERQQSSCGQRRSLFKFILIFLVLNSLATALKKDRANHVMTLSIDPNGYIAYCPCMGRFGNQADQFLGSLGFAKKVNRTLILPPWVEYIPYQAGSLQVPFDKYFDPNVTSKYHRVITMEIFMDQLAPMIWPPHKRISFCYAERGVGKGCDAKEGNPFGPFWDKYKIDFVKSEIFGPDLHYGTYSNNLDSWSKYNGQDWSVLAFVGPPSVFPVEKNNVNLQEYLVWNEDIESQVNKFISTLPRGRFVGIHLRNGVDWLRACEHVDDSRSLFASPQCTGYRNEYGNLTPEVCFPSTTTIITQLMEGVKEVMAKSVFVASDSNHLITELSSALGPIGVSVHSLSYASPHVDLAILGKANLFIGNCVSSFSAFVKRERDLNGFPSKFWAFPPIKTIPKTHHEL